LLSDARKRVIDCAGLCGHRIKMGKQSLIKHIEVSRLLEPFRGERAGQWGEMRPEWA
jgi:hypothetical protein